MNFHAEIEPGELVALLAEFEREGLDLPPVTPLAALYAGYRDWCTRTATRPAPLTRFVANLVRHHDCMPCRLAGGAIGLIGIELQKFH